MRALPQSIALRSPVQTRPFIPTGLIYPKDPGSASLACSWTAY